MRQTQKKKFILHFVTPKKQKHQLFTQPLQCKDTIYRYSTISAWDFAFQMYSVTRNNSLIVLEEGCESFIYLLKLAIAVDWKILCAP